MSAARGKQLRSAKSDPVLYCTSTPLLDSAHLAAAATPMPAIAPAPDTMERTWHVGPGTKPGDVKSEDGVKFVYREKPETFVDCTWHCGEICGMPCDFVKGTVDAIIAANQGILLLTEAEAQEAKKIFQEHPEVTGIHPGMKCDASGQSPIMGHRYHLRDGEKNLCQAEFDKLSVHEKASYEAIEPPVEADQFQWKPTTCKEWSRLYCHGGPPVLCNVLPYVCCVHVLCGRFCPGRQCPCLAACGRPSPCKLTKACFAMDSVFLSEKSMGPGWTCGALYLFDEGDEEAEEKAG